MVMSPSNDNHYVGGGSFLKIDQCMCGLIYHTRYLRTPRHSIEREGRKVEFEFDLANKITLKMLSIFHFIFQFCHPLYFAYGCFTRRKEIL